LDGEANQYLSPGGERGGHGGHVRRAVDRTWSADPPAALPELPLQLGAAGEVRRVGWCPGQFRVPDREAELPQFGEHRGHVRVARRPDRTDTERLRP